MEKESWIWFFSVIERQLGEARFDHFFKEFRKRKSTAPDKNEDRMDYSKETIMKGYIRKRGEKSWALCVELARDPETRKRKQHFQTINGTKKDAERALREILQTVENGSFIKTSKLTVGEYLEEWLQGYVKTNTSPRTRERYGQIIHLHLIPSLGPIQLTLLQPLQIQNYYSKALQSGRRDNKGGLSAKTVHYHHRILFEALRHGVKHGILTRNVAKSVDPPKPQYKEPVILGPSEVNLLLNASKHSPYYLIFFTAIYTGMRRSELLGIRWCDVDLDFATLSITQTLQQLSTGEFIFREPKTSHGRRLVSLPPALALLLREHRMKQEAEQFALGKLFKSSDLIFCHPNGLPLRPNSIARAFGSVAKRIGLLKARFHDLRHAHATIMLRQGIHPKIVSERLGQSSITMTLDIYSHVIPGLQEAAALRFEEGLKNDC